MEAERSRRVYELFYAALEVPPEQRSGFLRRACRDESIRRGVRSLLETDTEPETFLRSPLSSGLLAEAGAPPDRLIGRTLGQYTVRRLIGAGGMGVVYEAEQEHPRRTVAIKLVRTGVAGSEGLRRFRHEVDVLARLNHPGIAQVFDAGVLEEGAAATPYFAMEFVAGARDVLEFARDARLDRAARIELLARVCDAVEHGHQRGVIHRDLKPGNVLVDEAGQPKVIDFGVARLTAGEETAFRTQTGQLVGTLRYMSPEQCQGVAQDVDTRTDVYALGVILYELLTGEFPYDVDTPSPYELPRVIRESEPRRPSAIDRTLRGDAETILLKALSKDRERRYPSVRDLARDLRRFLRHEAIDARRDGGWYVMRKALRRHWIATAVTLGFLTLCGVSAALLVVLYRQAESQRAKTAQALEVADQRAYFSAIALGQAALKEGDARQLLQQLEACPADLRRWEWHYLRRLADTSVRTFGGGGACTLSADGRTLVAFAEGGAVTLLDVATGETERALECDHRVLRCVAMSPDGSRLVTGGDDCMVRFWELPGGRLIRAQRADSGRVVSLSFAPDGEHVASGGFDDGVKLWDARSGAPVAVVAADFGASSATFAPDGRLLGCATRGGDLLLWDLETDTLLRSIPAHEAPLLAPIFASDGRRAVTAAQDARVRLWDVASGALLRTIETGTQMPRAVALSLDDRRVAVVSQAVRVWDLETGVEESRRLGHVNRVSSVAFSPDGRTLYSAGGDGAIKVWSADRFEEPRRLRGHADFVRSVAVFPDGERVASTGRDGTIRIWHYADGREIGRLEGHGPGDQELVISPDGRLIVSGGMDGRIGLHDVAQGVTSRFIETGHGPVCGVAVSPDGSEIASSGADGTCRFWSTRDGSELAAVRVASSPLRHVAYSHAGRQVLASGDDSTVHLYDRDGLRRIRSFAGHAEGVLSAAFSADDGWIASVGGDATVRIWERGSGRLLHTCRGHTGVVQSVAFLPDGSRLISGGYDHVINLWDPRSGTLVMTLRGHKGGVPGLAVSPDGTWFASGSNDGTIGLWPSK